MDSNSYWITKASQANWEAASAAGKVTIVKDSKIVEIVSGEGEHAAIDKAFEYLHHHQSASIPWAIAYEGWRVYSYKDGDVVGQDYEEKQG